MPAYYQVTKLRAEQSAAVWGLQPGFTSGAKTRDDLLALLAAYTVRIDALSAAEADYSLKLTAKNNVLAGLRIYAINGAGKMSADLADDDPLDIALGQKVFSTDAHGSEPDLIKRCRALLPIWESYNAQLAAADPGADPVPAFKIRGKGVGDFRGELGDSYEAKVDQEQLAATTLSKERTAMESHNRAVDRLIKAWYAAWKNEYPAGTTEGDALLAQVEAESGQQKPSKLELEPLAHAADHKVRVTFVPGGGERATLRHLQVKIVGVDSDFRVVRELSLDDVANGVEIGPFTQGQQIIVRTDVGNSRDPSEISAEQSIVVA